MLQVAGSLLTTLPDYINGQFVSAAQFVSSIISLVAVVAVLVIVVVVVRCCLLLIVAYSSQPDGSRTSISLHLLPLSSCCCFAYFIGYCLAVLFTFAGRCTGWLFAHCSLHFGT